MLNELLPPPTTSPPSPTPEVFRQDQLEAHAARMAAAHTVATDSRRGQPLLPRLDESAERLDDAYTFLSAAARIDPQPSEDWLRDNHHVVQDQVRGIRQHLPGTYYRELPKLADGPLAGFPRVYLLARELTAHTSGRLDLDTVIDCARAYQRVTPLSIGETWAVPIMLRLALVEQLRLLADGVVAARKSRDAARGWHAELASGKPLTPQRIDRVLEDGRASDGRLSAAFVVELLQWLRDQPATAAPLWQALHDALEAQDDTLDEMLRVEHQREAADQLAIGNVITSMRLLSSVDWTLFFERVNVVEQELRKDPAGAYARMDFATRDRYRHSVERVAKRIRMPELEVAARAISLAVAAVTDDPVHDRRHHVGYYLISRGRFVLEEQVGYRAPIRERLTRFVFAHQALGYLGTIASATAVGVASLLLYGGRHGATTWELWLVALAVLLPVSELAISLINLIVTSQVPPRQLPKLDMRDGIPPELRTMVVVPVMVDTAAGITALFDDLEVRFLGNRDPHLHFALLADFPDADQASRPGDAALLDVARGCVDVLNTRYGRGRFFYFHRERRWNPSEGRWMGWERKRGKLAEFNRLLRAATDTSFILSYGDISLLPSVKFVITLDSDTQLPMDAGRRLVGTLAHPLNRPRFDLALKRVTEGYGVLQPRVGVDLVSANRTAFAKVFSGHVGVDPYTTAVSDVYQDLFHEGSYVGKGIYDVDAFHASLADRVPENTLLSHDLFEGFYARAGLCTDALLVDDYPANYLTFAARQHRWVRGDWQIARWLRRTVPDASGHHVRNTLPAIARWKILDNLRRSLLSPALVALLILGWTVLPGSSLLWSVLAVAVLAFPAYTQVARSLGSRVRGVPWKQHVAAERDNVVTSARQAVLWSTFLAHQSWLMLDAIGRTTWRLLVTRRHLLEWVSTDRSPRMGMTPQAVLRRMWVGPALGIVVLVLVAATAPSHLALALPMVALWIISPAIALATARPLVHERQDPDRAERQDLRLTARRTWRFFEELLTPADHWLVPDNYQENRKDQIAHRTSPTNIGLQLLSTLSAYHFGYISLAKVVDRLTPTFATLGKLPRYRGHFYNWYDTTTLAPLVPTYVSTVDSGNLAGYLLVLNSGLVALANGAPVFDRNVLEGIGDALALFESCLGRAERKPAAAAARAMKKELAEARTLLGATPASLPEWRAHLSLLADRLGTLTVLLQDAEDTSLEPGDSPWLAEAAVWLERAEAAVADAQADLDDYASWTALPLPDGFEGPPPTVTLQAYAAWCRDAAAPLGRPDDERLRAALERSEENVVTLIGRALSLAEDADELAEQMDFRFLYNEQRQLFSIGFSVTDGRLDGSYYDTFASEARLASFVAIALGQVSHDHWFKLGRSLSPAGATRALLSWSASMFEYLMPLLVMRVYPGTLLDETYHAVIDRQRQYAAQRGVPWGISESAYNAVDIDRNYQYRAFGVPGLGLKRGLGDDLVIAPYASMLAAPLVPVDVLTNLQHLEKEGAAGRYGFFEAIDYTPDRRPEGERGGVVLPTYMAHHQGMSLVSLDNALHDWPMHRYFHADPRIQAADLLLQERIPQLVPLKNPPVELAEHVPSARFITAPPVLRHETPHTLSPRAYLLSNGSYVVMLTNAGGGYSRRQQTAMTRWREDVTTDAWGSFCYIRDPGTDEVWSTAYQPTAKAPDEYEVTFAPDRAVFRRVDGSIETRTEIAVSPEDDAELRRVGITNNGTQYRTIELTSYAEVVLAPADSDLAHPAFSNLFIETAAVPERQALICSRRPRSGTARQYLVHVLSGGGGRAGVASQYETDRARFIGRTGTLERPAALVGTAPLSNTTGPVLDPIVSLRQVIRLPPGATARFTFTTAYADSEESARRLIDKYHDRRAVARAIALASTHNQVELRHLGLSVKDTMRFQRLGGRMITGDSRLRSVEAIEQNTRGQRDLWKYGISGDIPILLVQVADGSELPLVVELLKAHEYLRSRGLSFDLVVLNEHPASYLQELQEEIQRLVERSPEHGWIDKPAGVFLRRADLMPVEDQLLLRAAARIVMDASDGGLRQQLSRARVPVSPQPTRTSVSEKAPPSPAPLRTAAVPLEAYNGSGGFADGGRQFVIPVHAAAGVLPPVPWSNVVAHAQFGFACTETGPGYTWSGNSHDNRLTPWRNDPVSDAPGEAVFIRDDEDGEFWSATPLPAGGGEKYTVRHAHGDSTYEHERRGVASELVLFVPREAPVKVFRLTLKNTSANPRRLSVTLYAEWVLGENRSRTAAHVMTWTEPATGAVTARNVFRQEFPERIAFLDLWSERGHVGRTLTGDRTEFIGRNASLGRPAALGRESLSGRTGPAMDPCGAVQVQVDLAPESEQVVIGLLGDASDEGQVRALVERYRHKLVVDEARAEVRGFWDGLLGTTTVRTPDRAMDLVLNRWLLYQTLACRIWARSAFYQSSGAFGFRDQLQDMLALVTSAPHLLRAHLLHAASRQFVEGDVQHWWHEPGGQGVRTRFSDDRLWLVYATLRYIEATGDDAVLDEQVPFLSGRVLNPDEHEAYEQPSVSSESGTLFEHCRRAVAISLATGAHALPLMGTGDWNDGMSLVGAGGKGESVWLASFLVSILPGFADIAAARGDGASATMYREHVGALTSAIEAAWDGAWYRRAYFDDGTPLGSKDNAECQIDAIAQSWSVLAGTLDPQRARQAMESVYERLIRKDDRLALLLTPPFDHMVPSPGYIQGYLPGVRENGGQYTHAALWNVLAFTRLGDGDRAAELFSLLNPVNYTATAEQVARYRAEPYVVAADVYSVPPHTGRGGWTWYTGSAGWMYRIGIEAILGVTLRRGALHIDPCIPRNWPSYEVIFKPARTTYRIVVENPSGVSCGVRRLELDGADVTGQDVPIADDGVEHTVRVVLGDPHRQG